MNNRFQSMEGWLENIKGKLYVVSKYDRGITPKFKTSYGYFYEVLSGWESFNGIYWFQLTKPDKNKICFGFVQMVSAEFGNFDISELKSKKYKLKVWEIGKANLPYSGITDKPENWAVPIFDWKIIWKSQEEKELFKLLNALDFTDEELYKIIFNCSFPIKDEKSFELAFKNETFGSYEISIEEEEIIILKIENDEIFKKAILDFQAGQKS